MSELFLGVSPAWPLLIGGLLCALLPSHLLRKAVMIAAPLAGGAVMLATPEPGVYGVVEIAGYAFETYRYDGLSRVWGLVFLLAAFLNGVYALHERNRLTDAAALLYAGSAVGAVFAGDLLTLFFFWEGTAIASVFLIWATNTRESFRAGLRYLAIQVLSGVLLLGGAALWARGNGWAFNAIGIDSFAGQLIFLALGIKACFPLLHAWMTDAYPKATATGAVVLSAFTTKLAIYALARGYAGTEILVWIGAVMALFPILWTVVENDLRKVLAHALNIQLGFLVAGVGVGTELALSGVAAHAFVHVIYKGLLFMTMGAVLHRVGTTKASELGGLWKSMPATTLFCLIGAGALAAAPLFSAFVSKTLILSAALKEGYFWPFAMLVFASTGVLEHSGFKVPYFGFFQGDRGRRVREAPWNMLLAMGAAAALCIYLGIDYRTFYAILPYPVDYEPYTLSSVLGQVQLLLGAVFVFALLVRFRIYPRQEDRVILDVDWIYRKAGDGLVRWSAAMLGRLGVAFDAWRGGVQARFGRRLFELFSPAGAFARDFPSGLMALWTAAMLAMVLVVAYVSTL